VRQVETTGIAGAKPSSDGNPAPRKSGTSATHRTAGPRSPGDHGVPEHKLMMALFEGLAAEDPKDLHPVPGLAESWEISPDGRVYTFHLRKNGQWSDGSPLTADDCLQSYKRMLTPGFASSMRTWL